MSQFTKQVIILVLVGLFCFLGVMFILKQKGFL
jgi:hypothetical protein